MFPISYVQPAKLDEALSLLKDNDGSTVVMAGGTDLLLRFRSGKLGAKRVVSLELPELQTIEQRSDATLIGASVKLTDLIRALQNAAQPMPMVVESAASVGSCQTRNLATIAGNFCTGNASADMATALLAANSSVIIRSAEGERELPIDQFFIRNRCVALAPNEIVTAIRIPHADPTLTVGSSFMKIGKRRGHVIAALNGAAMVGLDADGVIRDIRLAVGTLAPCPIRLYRCEQAALNRPLDDALLAQLSELMLEEISPRDSLRASKEFRTSVASVVLRRTIHLAAGLEEDELC